MHTYIISSIPPYVLWVMDCYRDKPAALASAGKWVAAYAMTLAIVFFIALQLFPVANHSEKNLVAVYNTHDPAHIAPLIYWEKRPFSAQFYAEGHAEQINQIGELQAVLQHAGAGPVYIVTKVGTQLPSEIELHLTWLASNKVRELGVYQR